MDNKISSRQRVINALRHENTDRVPVDFLATVEIWQKLIKSLDLDINAIPGSIYINPEWEAVLRSLKIDCRVLSYDQFFEPPESFLKEGTVINWWDALSRSTPNRMFRLVHNRGDLYDLWGHHLRVAKNPTGAYEEYVSFPLKNASDINDIKNYLWPNPDWWNFDPLQIIIEQLDKYEEYHIRFRIGSIFEVAWQLCGMDTFMMDLAVNPKIPLYIMDRLTEIYVENTKRVLDKIGDRLDMVYFYDDVATQNSLMISKDMWRKYIKPRHAQLVDVSKKYNKKVMYHCDGSIYPLIPELIDLGIDVLNPIQVDAKNMEAERLKSEFGDRLCFHGGIDIIKTLPDGTIDDVKNEVRERINVLGNNGGYIMASTHHIQSNTPIENVIAMYDMNLRSPAN
jgi:uroporphyrinogen decarboxylase